jgi:hypothetical protein
VSENQKTMSEKQKKLSDEPEERKKERKKERIPFTETETECLRIRAMDSERLQSSLWFCEIL